MSFYTFLQKNKTLVFLNRCRLLRRNPEVTDFVMGGYKSSKWLNVSTNENGRPGFICSDIREYGRQVGFFSEVIFTLFRLYFANQRGMIPVVTWDKDNLYYEENGVDGEKNVFLYYFDKVSELKSPDDAKYVVRSGIDHISELQDYFDTHGYDISDTYVSSLSGAVKKYIKYNEKTQKYLDEEFTKLLGDSKKTLAVHFRGTDYRRQYNNHPVFVTIEEEIEKAKELIESKGYEQIFLATDEQEAVDRFKKEFGDIVKVYEDTYRASKEDDSVAYSNSERPLHHYKLGLEVLRDQYTLTRCEGLICGISNLTICARLMRNAWYEPYEDLVVINKGINHNDKRFSQASH